MIWLSVDAALNKSGVALWDGARLVEAVTLRPAGSGGKWARWSHGVKLHTYPTRLIAWRDIGDKIPDTYVTAIERGQSRGADHPMGRAVGYLEALADMRSGAFHLLELSTWRRAIAEEMAERGSPVTWPPKDTKAVAIACARALYPQLGADVTDDEAEAVLIGHAAMRLRTLEVQQ